MTLPGMSKNRQSRGKAGVAKAAASLLFLGLSGHAGLALPPDPQRPFSATTCDAAMSRLEEALIGNPLISDVEMAEVTMLARQQAERLCGSDAVAKMMTGFGKEVKPAAKGVCSSDRSD